MTRTGNTTTIAFVGAGNISGPYADSIERHEELKIVGVFDVDVAKAAEFASKRSCMHFGSVDELALAAPDITLNLTSPPYHFATTRDLLDRGLNVYSEKPLALTSAEAEVLVQLSARSSATVACSPSLWLGRAYQDAGRRIVSGEIGEVFLVTAEVNQGRIEAWHPAPRAFYQVGPVVDAGVYPLTYTSAVLGPITSVSATSARAMPVRETLDGENFEIQVADVWVVAVTFQSGALLRLTANFAVSAETVPRSVQFHGDAGSLRIDDWILPDATVSTAEYGEPFKPVEGGEAEPLDWALGVLDLADAIREGRRPRVSIEHAAHIVEVLGAISLSAAERRPVSVSSTFPSPFATQPHEQVDA